MIDGSVLIFDDATPSYRLAALLSANGQDLEIGWSETEHAGLDGLDRIMTSYVLGNLVALALRLSGRIVLHGNAVCIGDRSIAWIGGKGAGKSTLSAAFTDAGYATITDDQLVLRKGPQGDHPAYGVPRIRLWPNSLQGMARTTMTAYSQPFGASVKGWLEFDVPDRFDEAAPPLAALYVLEPRSPAHQDAQLGRPSPAERLVHLLHHRLGRISLPLPPERLETELRALAGLGTRIPIRTLRLPDDLDALPQVIQRLVALHADPHGS
ncbi:hypothetical protein [Thiohalocapsa marina]|uniref:hypothetical protein n=1 Tax=Thiohalocapsa marina TaxID=424902 RepID=UPI0036DA4615